MSLAVTEFSASDSGVKVVDTLDGLAAIKTPACAAAIWERTPLQSFQSWINRLDPIELPRARVVVRPNTVREAVVHICDMSAIGEGFERNMLVDDIAALASGFASISNAPFLRLRLDGVNTNACSKFHVDVVTSRLICTYRGTGTQYGFATGGGEPQRIETTPTGSPIVLRGKLWPEHPATHFVHRSPPIAGTGETRLLLVLDPIDDPDLGAGIA